MSANVASLRLPSQWSDSLVLYGVSSVNSAAGGTLQVTTNSVSNTMVSASSSSTAVSTAAAGITTSPGTGVLTFAAPNRTDTANSARARRDTALSSVAIRGATKSLLVAEWEGHVTAIEKDAFVAMLRGVFGDGVEGESEEATIPLTEAGGINEGLLAVGALFRMCVSYEEQPSRPIRRYTEVIFRRLPAYRQQDLDEAQKRGRELLNGLRVE